jgi:hypothetical protein
MLNSEEGRLVHEHAYLPEHIPAYVEAVSGGRPYLVGDHLCFFRKNHLLFIGYPLSDERASEKTPRDYESACKHFNPTSVAVIAPRIWFSPQSYEAEPQDSYYRLGLPCEHVDPKVAYMVRRARRELTVRQGEFKREHKKLVKGFLSSHDINEKQKAVFKAIPLYLQRSRTARILEARKGSCLVAFTILDLDAAHYAFYLFHFRSLKEDVPGASDLLFYEMIRLAVSEGKEAINLGLGIHPGIRRFKEKWGGMPFLPYVSAVVRKKSFNMDPLMNKL